MGYPYITVVMDYGLLDPEFDNVGYIGNIYGLAVGMAVVSSNRRARTHRRLLRRVRDRVGNYSLDTVPVTGSLLFAASVRRLTVSRAAVFCLCMLIECNNCLRFAVCRALRFLQRLRVDFVMATGGDTPAEARSAITFGVTLEVPWNAPEAYVQLHSDHVFDLEKTVVQSMTWLQN